MITTAIHHTISCVKNKIFPNNIFKI
jgi:hypothetical protein